jgi:hypothetical protein
VRYGKPFPVYEDYKSEKCDMTDSKNPGALTENINLNLKFSKTDC